LGAALGVTLLWGALLGSPAMAQDGIAPLSIPQLTAKRAAAHRSGAWTREASLLVAISEQHMLREECAPAAKAARDAVSILRRHGAPKGLPLALLTLGTAEMQEADLQAAGASLKECLRRLPPGGKPSVVRGDAVGALGSVALYSGNPKAALPLLYEALAIHRAAGHAVGVCNDTAGLASSYWQTGRLDLAGQRFREAFRLARGNPRFPRLEVAIHQNHAAYLTALGRGHDSAVEMRSVARDARRLGMPLTECVALTSLGGLLPANEDPLACLDRAKLLAARLRLGPQRTGDILVNRAVRLLNAGKCDEATKAAEEGLRVVTDPGNALRPYFRDTIATCSMISGQTEKALGTWASAVAAARRSGDRAAEAEILGHATTAFPQYSASPAAIFILKTRVNLLQDGRSAAARLGHDAQRSFVAKHEAGYRDLAWALVFAYRYSEAIQALDLLKTAEFAGYQSGMGEDLTGRHVDLTPVEARWETQYGELARRVEAAQKASGAISLPGASPAPAVDPARAEQDMAGFIVALAADATTHDAPGTGLSSTPETRAVQDALKDAPGTVAFFTLVAPPQGAVIAVTADSVTAASAAMSTGELAPRVERLYRLLSKHPLRRPKASDDVRAASKAVYDVMFAQVGPYLNREHVRNVVWVLDGPLRFVPMAALWDGSHYLGEYCAHSVSPSAALASVAIRRPVEPALGVGRSLSSGEEFGRLPSVPLELKAIIRETPGETGVLPGRRLLNGAFTERAVLSASSDGYRLLHVASHFRLHPTSPSLSGLLLGEGSGRLLTLQSIARRRGTFAGMGLVTLSACDTGVGPVDSNGVELDALGRIVLQQGARSSICSLWSVDSDGATALMTEFYRGWVTGGQAVGAAEALRQAQLRLLRHEVVPPSVFGRPARTDYSDPYFWAPFYLVGDWR
jgi:CHAT domain-containing protein/tetratricopeptide (TPR) repeat protein